MKKFALALGIVSCIASAHAQVYINEMLVNPPGADSSATRGLEFFELRGTPNLSLSGYYLLSIEGQGTTGRGDINQFFNLSSFSIGANGYLAAVQYRSPYAILPGASVVSNSFSYGWGQANSSTNSSAGHSSDAAQLDLENSAATMVLVNIGSGAAPSLTLDLDSNNDGVMDLPSGWSVLDSVGVSDSTGTAPAASDLTYGAITFRVGGVGSSNGGNTIDIDLASATSIYVARKGDSTGSTADDWFGSVLNGSAPGFVIESSTDSYYEGKTLVDMQLGGVNPVPEPSTWALLGLGIVGVALSRARRFSTVK